MFETMPGQMSERMPDQMPAECHVRDQVECEIDCSNICQVMSGQMSDRAECMSEKGFVNICQNTCRAGVSGRTLFFVTLPPGAVIQLFCIFLPVSARMRHATVFFQSTLYFIYWHFVYMYDMYVFWCSWMSLLYCFQCCTLFWLSSVKNLQERKLYGDETKLGPRKWNPRSRKSAEALAEVEADRPIREGPRKQGLFSL